ncbi:DUF1642 domain-containing protein [Streptococcus suis]|uniref:DUF1642 domain-containing protein n=1 Tax=Streptococcus suis TaxID=1307 RepID=UPI0005CDA1FD|nr:DUF1642 domain-containing protein [Streptococcus suis]MCK3990861.1 DUF1642 domain-containing protein [Streptococcus suis]MDE1695560.1 DUF1642 domain-containing protein [Streptococcus suis]NQL58551.1 DUF1642 domain-containing protein [Streptococcus suis]NQL92808.1 DUF1642 domain-containing protein [Streptococcus suis]NQM09462.1 DUF1642 domain-containing protein [Streptococcus suis]
MNKQEAIKRIEQMGEYERFVDEPISKGSVLNIISQIHEPQKVVVPKFIGDLIEELKIDEYTIGEIGACVYDDEEQKWIDDNEEQFYRAFLDGYEIEQEQLYTVEIPNPNRTTEPIIYLSRDEGGKIFLNNWFLHVSQNWKNQPHARLAEAEIKQDFEWAWQFAKEVE